ncbi:MAG: NAD(+)/NADH kinase [Sandaracinus sp.]|nr:NAD(+)/NADH kinase [Sandaracinus sp.]MCB9613301.1 NAD(+)/NADH kinase [Sandaracinus sp.]MCB9624261.1 NAD(+)/NADH kinase [Sandaracinus sp.]MCB9634033.1 NAD(+)/NADH kinase [Sandaracinus sp.]
MTTIIDDSLLSSPASTRFDTDVFVRPKRRPTEPTKFGVVYNPRATANVGRAPLRAIGTPCVAPTTHAELVDALRELAQREVDTVVVSGGDGTVRDVLSAIPKAYAGMPEPSIAVLPAGRTDLIAGDIGAQAREDELARLLAASRDRTLRTHLRPVFRIDDVIAPNGEVRTVRGMLFGALAFEVATRIGQGEIHATGASHGKAVTMTVVRTLENLFLRGDPDALRRGRPVSMNVDGRDDIAGADPMRSLLLVSGLRGDIVLDRSPFWGPALPHELRYLDVHAPTRGIVRAFGALLSRRPWLAGESWRSGAASTIDLGMDRPFVVDGEIFEPQAGHSVRIVSDGPTRFVAPA